MYFKNNTLYAIRFTLGICLCCSLILSCGTTYRYAYPGHKTFTEESIGALRVGMSSAEVSKLLGEPDEQYVSAFGSDVGEEWSGRVWVYFVELDTRFDHAKRYKKNLLVFYPSDGDMKLNHWEIEVFHR